MLANAIHHREGTMQLRTCGALPTAAATRLWQGFSGVPSMRLEDVAPEESKIRDLERRIVDERRKGEPVDSLVDERRRTYDSWIARLDHEIGDPRRDQQVRDRLQRQRERAIRDYGQPISGAAHSPGQ